MYLNDEILNGIASLGSDATFDEFELYIHSVVDNMIVESLGISMEEYNEDRNLPSTDSDSRAISVSKNLANMDKFVSALRVIHRLSRFSTYSFNAYDVVTAALTYPHRNYLYSILVARLLTFMLSEIRHASEEEYSIENNIRLLFKDELSNENQQAVNHKLVDLITHYSNGKDYPKYSTHLIVTVGLLLNEQQVDVERIAKLILKHVHIDLNEDSTPSFYQDESTKFFFNIVSPHNIEYANKGNTVAAYISDTFKDEGKLYKMFKLLNADASNYYDTRYKSSM